MMKVLIVNDNRGVIEALGYLTRGSWPEDVELEIIPRICKSAAQAIGAIEHFDPDILLLDFSFGIDSVGTGADVAVWIDANKPRLKVATTTIQPEDVARALFSKTKCVTHFLSVVDVDAYRKFFEYCTKS